MAFERYNLTNLKKAVRNPSLFRDEIYRLVPNPTKIANKLYFRAKYGEGINVMQEDWDNLFILDALRYDYFERHNYLEGEISKVISKGAHSWEFMEGNFVGKTFHDTVYVTANPHVEKMPDTVFYTTKTLFDRWEDDPGTVLPEDVVDAAIQTYAAYPNKRIVVHFMQPHGPHLGPTADSYRERLGVRSWTPPERNDRGGMRWDHAAAAGEISPEEIRKAYAETLEIVLEHVETLVEKLEGKSVITSDHGQMLGERLMPMTSRIFGHPHDIYTRELRIVPWFEIDTQNRREVYPEEPVGHEETDEELVEERLRALGYT